MYIPIIIDSAPFLQDFEMVRCIYFAVEGKPLFQSTSFDSIQFSEPKAIENEFELIENRLEMNIEIEELFIPITCFDITDDGTLYRISEKSFRLCLKLKNKKINPHQFMEKLPDLFHNNASETVAFREFRRGKTI